jgi:hypothetical protein
MGDRYRLPEALGGGEREGEYFWSGCAGAMHEHRFKVPNVGYVTVSTREPLTKVGPPLPPEPPDVGAVVQVVDVAPGSFRVFERGPESAGERWWPAGDGAAVAWEHICGLGTPVRLVPDPAAGVELPWRGGHPQAPFTVSFGDQGGAAIVSSPGPFILAAVDARAMAAALWAAADAAEASQ